MEELPVPEALRRSMNSLEGNASGFIEGSLQVAVPERNIVDLHPYFAEYIFNHGNVLVHFFRKEGGLFPGSFRGRIYRAFTTWPGKHAGIHIEWIDDMQSWCVTVLRGAELPPGEEEIVRTIRLVTE